MSPPIAQPFYLSVEWCGAERISLIKLESVSTREIHAERTFPVPPDLCSHRDQIFKICKWIPYICVTIPVLLCNDTQRQSLECNVRDGKVSNLYTNNM
jgi:hypothetical protein